MIARWDDEMSGEVREKLSLPLHARVGKQAGIDGKKRVQILRYLVQGLREEPASSVWM